MSIITRGMPDGHVAIYHGPRDTAIEADPHADLGRVLFHTRLDYTVVQRVETLTLNLPAGPYDSSGKIVHNVLAHGLPYTPLIFGMVKNCRGVGHNGGMDPAYQTEGPVPFSGTVVLGSAQLISTGYAFKMLQLGCNDTHVTVTDLSPYVAGYSSSYLGTYYNTFTYALEVELWITKTALPI